MKHQKWQLQNLRTSGMQRTNYILMSNLHIIRFTARLKKSKLRKKNLDILHSLEQTCPGKIQYRRKSSSPGNGGSILQEEIFLSRAHQVMSGSSMPESGRYGNRFHVVICKQPGMGSSGGEWEAPWEETGKMIW